MWCAYCMEAVNRFIEHDLCKLQTWLTLSRDYTQARETSRSQYNFEPKGETVELRPRLTRSASI